MSVRVSGVGGMDSRTNDWTFHSDEHVSRWRCFTAKTSSPTYRAANLTVLHVTRSAVPGSGVRGGYWMNDLWYTETKDTRYRWFRSTPKCSALSADTKSVFAVFVRDNLFQPFDLRKLFCTWFSREQLAAIGVMFLTFVLKLRLNRKSARSILLKNIYIFDLRRSLHHLSSFDILKNCASTC